MAEETKLAGFEQALRDRIRGDVIFDEVGRGIVLDELNAYIRQGRLAMKRNTMTFRCRSATTDSFRQFAIAPQARLL